MLTILIFIQKPFRVIIAFCSLLFVFYIVIILVNESIEHYELKQLVGQVLNSFI